MLYYTCTKETYEGSKTIMTMQNLLTVVSVAATFACFGVLVFMPSVIAFTGVLGSLAVGALSAKR